MASIDEMQLKRMERFPKNRIAFWNSNNAIQEDIKNFRLWTKGMINLDALCRYTARSNHLPKVTEEQMVNERTRYLQGLRVPQERMWNL